MERPGVQFFPILVYQHELVMQLRLLECSLKLTGLMFPRYTACDITARSCSGI